MNATWSKLYVLSFALLFAGAVSATAQTTVTESEAGVQNVFATNVFGVGISASLCSGMGLSFRQHFADVPAGYQLTGGIWKTHDLYMYDMGAEIQYDLFLSVNRLYALGGIGYYYYGNTDRFGINKNGLDSPLRFGAGIGYEMPYSRSVGASISVMITAFEPSGDIIPLPSLGFHIYFK
jgi:hypothetical protein